MKLYLQASAELMIQISKYRDILHQLAKRKGQQGQQDAESPSGWNWCAGCCYPESKNLQHRKEVLVHFTNMKRFIQKVNWSKTLSYYQYVCLSLILIKVIVLAVFDPKCWEQNVSIISVVDRTTCMPSVISWQVKGRFFIRRLNAASNNLAFTYQPF